VINIDIPIYNFSNKVKYVTEAVNMLREPEINANSYRCTCNNFQAMISDSAKQSSDLLVRSLRTQTDRESQGIGFYTIDGDKQTQAMEIARGYKDVKLSYDSSDTRFRVIISEKKIIKFLGHLSKFTDKTSVIILSGTKDKTNGDIFKIYTQFGNYGHVSIYIKNAK